MSEFVVVALSGGVDSAVAAALLRDEGNRVVGLTMRMWADGSQFFGTNEVKAASIVARELGIPHYIIDFSSTFQREILGYFLEKYREGRTPNPCVVCNQKIKFGLLLGNALSLGARRMATGHYARLEAQDGKFLLKRGVDPRKDQSYFLARLKQESLSRIIFPVGSLSKEKVRVHARAIGLPGGEKRESQEVCFLSSGGLSHFLREKLVKREAVIVDTRGSKLGVAGNSYAYTVGQRRGLGISKGRPLYVLEVKPGREIVVGGEEDLYKKSFWAIDPHWIGEIPTGELRVLAKIRSRHEASPALLWPEGERVRVTFDIPQRAIAPGQLAVFYRGNTVIGSGWIEEVK